MSLSLVVDLRLGLLIPQCVKYTKKSSHFRTSSSLNMAVRGGFEPPIRCRIHTFQACSFSHSDTSPNCFAARPHRWQRGATIGSWSETVKKNLYRLICLVTQWTRCSRDGDYDRMCSGQLFIKSYAENMRLKKYQIVPFFRAKCNSLILFTAILKSGKRGWICDFVSFNSKSIG